MLRILLISLFLGVFASCAVAAEISFQSVDTTSCALAAGISFQSEVSRATPTGIGFQSVDLSSRTPATGIVVSPGDTTSRPSSCQLLRQTVAATIQVPAGVFSNSHSAGAGAEYAWYIGRRRRGSTQAGRFAFLLKAAGEYFIGRDEPQAGSRFRYHNYGYVTGLGGLVYRALPQMELMLVAGPGVGIYGGSSSVGINTGAGFSFRLRNGWAVGPLATYRKHKEASGLWTTGLRISYQLK